MTLQLIGTKTVQVDESSHDVNTHMFVQPSDTVIFSASGTIWAGVWFTGRNGPRGWPNTSDDSKFPAPGAHPYSLLGKLDSGWFEIGDNFRLDYAATGAELTLSINDDVHGNGNGSFECFIQHYRNQ